MPDCDRVIVIMTDTQRTDMLGCYGNAHLKTPALDRLARGGIRFERAYTCQPVCGPARSALFTGTFPHSNGSWGNSMPLSENVRTLGQRLSDAGVRTGYVGKWHLDGGDYFGMGRCPAGWDPAYWYDMRNYLEELTPDERRRVRNVKNVGDPRITSELTFGHRCSDRAIDFISRNCDERYFLVVSYDEPHHPFICPEPYASMYKDYSFPLPKNVADTLESKPENQRAWAAEALNSDRTNLQIRWPEYFGCNSFIDAQIGRVLDAIDADAPDALVIYTSDHGEMLHSHRLWGKGAAMYDEIARIPLIARCPGVIPQQSVCAHPVSHIDLAPTVLEAMGVAVPKLLEGRSLAPTLRDPSVRTNDAIFVEFTRYEQNQDGFGGFQPIRCIFDGRYKLVINLLATDELYDLTVDPGEMENLIQSAEHYAVRDALHDRLLQWMNDTVDPFRGYCWERRPWRGDARPPSWPYTAKNRQREHEEYEPRQLFYHTGHPIEQAITEGDYPKPPL